MLKRFPDDSRLGKVESVLEDRLRIQNDIDKLEQCPEINELKFSKDKCHVQYLRQEKSNE